MLSYVSLPELMLGPVSFNSIAFLLLNQFSLECISKNAYSHSGIRRKTTSSCWLACDRQNLIFTDTIKICTMSVERGYFHVPVISLIWKLLFWIQDWNKKEYVWKSLENTLYKSFFKILATNCQKDVCMKFICVWM